MLRTRDLPNPEIWRRLRQQQPRVGRLPFCILPEKKNPTAIVNRCGRHVLFSYHLGVPYLHIQLPIPCMLSGLSISSPYNNHSFHAYPLDMCIKHSLVKFVCRRCPNKKVVQARAFCNRFSMEKPLHNSYKKWFKKLNLGISNPTPNAKHVRNWCCAKEKQIIFLRCNSQWNYGPTS